MSVVETGMAISVLSGKNKSSGNSIKAIDNLKPNKPFTAFKVWIIKEDKTLYNHFQLS